MRKHNTIFKNKKWNIVALLLIITFISSSCKISQISASASNPTPCAPYTLSTSSTLDKGNFIVIVYEAVRTAEETKEAAETSLNLLIQELSAQNNKIILVPYEEDIILFNKNTPSNTLSNLTPLPDYPTLLPTLTPAPTRTSTLNNQHEALAVEITNENFRRINTFNCQALEIEKKNREYYIEEKSRFTSDFLSSTNTVNYSDVIRTYEALSFSSTILQDKAIDRSNYSNFYLILFSDMIEFRDKKPSEIDINLSNIKVLLILTQCDFSFTCTETEKDWHSQLTSFGASEVIPIYSEGVFQETINKILNQKELMP